MAIIAIGAIMRAVYMTAYETMLFDDGSKLGDQADEFIVVREIFLNLGRVAALGMVIILPWQMGFPLAAVAMWASMLSAKDGKVMG